MDSLLPELKRTLMKYLPLKDRKNLRLVNTTWHDAFTHNEVIRMNDAKDLTKMSMRCTTLILESDLLEWEPPEEAKEWATDGTHVKHLHLDTDSPLKIAALLKHFNKVEGLYFTHANHQDWSSLLDNILSCRNLVNLHIVKGKENNKFLKAIALALANQLKEFFIELYHHDEKEILNIVQGLGTQVTGMGLGNTQFTDAFLKNVCKYHPNLQKLQFWDLLADPECSNEALKTFSLTHVHVLAENCGAVLSSNLKALSIYYYYDTFRGCETIPEMPYLTDIRLDFIEGHEYSQFLTELIRKAPNLQTLQLREADKEILEVISEMEKLQYLVIDNLQIDDFAALNAVSQISQLACYSADFPTGCLNLPNLSFLAYCCDSPDEMTSITSLTSECPNLRHVFVSHQNCLVEQDVPQVDFDLYVGEFEYSLPSIFSPRKGMVIRRGSSL